MPKRTLSFTVSAEQFDIIQASFAKSGVNIDDGEIDTLVHLALDSWLQTFAGHNRYRSLTEQYLDWLKQIYTTLLRDEEPSERRLFTQLNFPFGQAQYLARILRDQRLGAWRRKALESLKLALESRLEEAKKWIKEARGEERMLLTISKGARVELDSMLGTLSEANTAGISPMKHEGSMGTRVSISIVASNLPYLVTEVNKQLKG